MTKTSLKTQTSIGAHQSTIFNLKVSCAALAAISCRFELVRKIFVGLKLLFFYIPFDSYAYSEANDDSKSKFRIIVRNSKNELKILKADNDHRRKSYNVQNQKTFYNGDSSISNLTDN